MRARMNAPNTLAPLWLSPCLAALMSAIDMTEGNEVRVVTLDLAKDRSQSRVGSSGKANLYPPRPGCRTGARPELRRASAAYGT